MAKRKKTAERIGKTPFSKPKPPRHDEPKAKVQQEDIGSDAGSFVDDDTDHFLPTKWAEKIKKDTKAGRGSTPEVEEDDEDEDLSSSVSEDLIIGSMVASVAAMSIKHDASAIAVKSTKSQLVHESSYTTPVKSKTIMLSRLEVPASLIRKSRTAMEDMQSQIKSLKRQLEKKERDLKAAKTQTTAAKSEAAEFLKQNQSLLSQVTKLKEVKEECEEMRGMVREHLDIIKNLESEHNEELKAQRKQAKKELRLEASKTRKALSEVQQMTAEEKDQLSTITNLRRDLAEKTAAHQNLQMGLEQEQQEHIASRNRCAATNAELADLREELVEERERARKGPSFEEQDLRRKHAEMSQELHNSKQGQSKLNGKIQKLQNNKAWLEVKVEALKEDLLAAKITRNELRKSLADEKSRVEQLEEKIKDLRSLVEVGVAIRLRFLEQARENFFELPKSKVDRCLIQDGNIMAHRASGNHDVALFKCDLVPEESLQEMKKIFEKLYETDPSEYPRYCPRIGRLTDCEATLMTLKADNDTTVVASKRKEFEKVLNELLEMNNRMEDDELENSVEDRDLLEELERLTDKIASADRFRNMRS